MNRTFLASMIAILGSAWIANGQGTLTFDDLPAYTGLGGNDLVPSGYGGLNWNFWVLDASIYGSDVGYRNGMISPNNVIYNPYGQMAGFSSAHGSFNLNSGYLTFGLNLPNDTLTVEVRGYGSGKLLYDNWYTLNCKTPLFVNFGYTGVDSVQFIPAKEQQFAIDNLTITVPEPGSLVLLVFGLGAIGARRLGETRRCR